MRNERAAPQFAGANEEAALEIWCKINPRNALDKKEKQGDIWCRPASFTKVCNYLTSSNSTSSG